MDNEQRMIEALKKIIKESKEQKTIETCVKVLAIVNPVDPWMPK